MKTILTIVGARPQFVKAAVVSKAMAEAGISERIVHTGQHYDHEMSTVFWEELGLPAPSVNLEVGSGNHGMQMGLIMQKLEEYIMDLDKYPDAVLVYGDTNSTLSGAIVASKLHIPVVHIEAGLRSFNREMPEEINRILTDHASDLLFCSSLKGVEQLKKEGITKNVFNAGDVMYNAVLTFSEIADRKYTLADVTHLKTGEFILATIHRPSNTDDPDNLKSIISAFGKLNQPVLWPVHPRNKSKLKDLIIPENLHLIDPVSYFKMLILLKNCSKVITDSGGLQKEAYWMKKLCITIREETEWVETLEGGWNILAGADEKKIISAVEKSDSISIWKPLYGEGNAAKKITEILIKLEQP
ncbi:MAG: UDP-N-acetylglucosamine 2-epimerase (non-hydrolyzing) [Balneolaceae bacterium]